MNTLIVIDLQKDFYDPSGSLYVKGAEKFPARIKEIVPQYDNVVFTLDWHPMSHCSFVEQGGPWPAHCVQYSAGASLPDEVLKAVDFSRQRVMFYQKGTRSYEEEYAAFKYISDNDYQLLQQSDEIAICGLCGDYCVGLSVERLVELGLKDRIVILTGCVGSIDGGAAFEETMKKYQLKRI